MLPMCVPRLKQVIYRVLVVKGRKRFERLQMGKDGDGQAPKQATSRVETWRASSSNSVKQSHRKPQVRRSAANVNVANIISIINIINNY